LTRINDKRTKHKEQRKRQKTQSKNLDKHVHTGQPAPRHSFKKTTAIIQFKKNKMTNSDAPQNYPGDDQNLQNEDPNNKGQQKASSPAGQPITGNAEPHYPDDLSTDQTSNRYDSENLDQESGTESKDITKKDIEQDLRENDPSEGSETDIDTPGSDEPEGATFETIEPEKDNPVNKEFEIGDLGNEELQEDERTRDESGNDAPGNIKPSQRKF
jgi:hypothetical protein